jgi:hypothetical protein
MRKLFLVLIIYSQNVCSYNHPTSKIKVAKSFYSRFSIINELSDVYSNNLFNNKKETFQYKYKERVVPEKNFIDAFSIFTRQIIIALSIGFLSFSFSIKQNDHSGNLFTNIFNVQSVVADDELAKFAAEGNKVSVDGQCFFKKCALETSACANNPNCLKGLSCLARFILLYYLKLK